MQYLRNFLIRFSSLICCSFAYPAPAQEKTAAFLDNLLRNHASPRLKMILDNPDSFRYQLLYTPIDRDSRNRASFSKLLFQGHPLE